MVVLSKRKILLAILIVLVVFNFYLFIEISSFKKDLLEVSFLDVGQGDSIFVKSPTGNIVIVDGGDGSVVMDKLSERLSFNQREIGLVVATHADKDHINGLIPIFDKYDVKTFLYSPSSKSTDVYMSLLGRVNDEDSIVYEARRNMVFDIGGGAYLEVLFPDRTLLEAESNLSSVVLRLVYRENEFLLTGDSPKSIEKYLTLLDKETLKSDVLKVGHHGSKTSTEENFLSVVSPGLAVLSFGKDNRYGHPHQEVLNLLGDFNVNVLSTAGEGSIVFFSDGENLSYKRD